MTVRNRMFDINGGAEVQRKAFRQTISGLILIPVLLLLFSAPQAFAQGSIFGSVTNSNATVPANGDVIFFGYLDNTDEEIRLESSIGAGYDNGNWFDDFQNYLTEAAGNPYDFHFYNTANGEYAVLSGLIPNNSFQQQNIALAPYAGNTVPITGLTGSAVSASTVVISWNITPNMTYHVYRRLSTSTGSFFRVDAPGGSLTNPGVTTRYFVDNTVDGVSSYQYLVIPQDNLGNFGPMHSNILTVNSAGITAPGLASINPNNGPYIGGTSVTITGANFDPNGASVTIGGVPMTSVTVVSPFSITGITPAGAVGTANVAVTNGASGLSSNVLTGGFTYNGNNPPVITPVGPIAGTEAVNVNFNVSATDPDLTIPAMSAANLPTGATFVDNGNGTGTFNWTPGYTQAGSYQITITATDGIEPTNLPVDINIADAGNQPPTVAPINPQNVAENGTLNLVVTATDPDLDPLSLTVTDAPANSNFVDNGDNTADFDFTPAFNQTGTYNVIFKAFDGTLVDSIIVPITVTNTNQVPVLAPIGPQAGTEGVQLTFGVSATDGDGVIPTLTALNLPTGATFVDNADGTGTFDWTPGFTDDGIYDVTFRASDGTDIDEEIVQITVGESGNQVPVVATIVPQIVTEGANLNFIVTATDPDGNIPALSALNLPTGATFVDNGDGTGTFDWTPGFDQAGPYSITFEASDGTATGQGIADITVNDSGNQAPVFDPVISDTTAAEGDSLILVVNASDPEGLEVFITMSTTFPATDYRFVDSGNGTAVFSLGTDYYSSGNFGVSFFATDYSTVPATSSMPVAVTITDVNQPPVVDSIGPFGVAADDLLTFTVTAFDSTSPSLNPRVFLGATGVPSGASFVDNGNNTGTFTWTPTDAQLGNYIVNIVATDQGSLTTIYPISIVVVLENRKPVFAEYPQYLMGNEGETITTTVSATDPDGNIPVLYAIKLPQNSTFTDNGDGSGTFVFNPSFVQAGLVQAIFAAYDGIAETRTDPIIIQVIEAGNQAPEFNPVTQQNVTEGSSLSYTISATDPDGTTPTLAATNIPENMTFVDNGDGTGTINFDPDFVQAGTYDITVTADDGVQQVDIIVTIVVDDAGNQPPVLTPVDPQSVNEMATLSFNVISSDPDTDIPDYAVMTAQNLPTGATYTDNGDGTGTFLWNADNFSAGDYTVTFVATDPRDGSLTDQIDVSITVTNVNQSPLGYIPPGQTTTLFEGQTVNFMVLATDADGTIPIIGIDSPAYALSANMTFVDNGDGSATLTFSPDYTQGNGTGGFRTFAIGFRIFDSEDQSISTTTGVSGVTFTVRDQNRPPVISTTANSLDTSMTEGQTMTFQLSYSDPDINNVRLDYAVENLPANATFSGTPTLRQFSFTPNYTQAGVYMVRFTLLDLPPTGLAFRLADTLDITITVLEAGNQAPVFTSISGAVYPTAQALMVGEPYTTTMSVSDPDGEAVTFTMESTNTPLTTYSFTDNGNSTASMTATGQSSELYTVHEVHYIATDAAGLADTAMMRYIVVPFIRGDANTDGQMDMSDVMYIINYLFKQGPPPTIDEAADANYDYRTNILDADYLIGYFFKQGPPPPAAPSN